MTKTAPNPVDIHVGNRVRLRRVLLGYSQERLGEALDLTFQQVQKYEKGTNRISASRLFEIAKILEVPVQFFFEGIADGALSDGNTGPQADTQTTMMNFLNSAEGLQLTKAFMEISDQAVRRRIIELVKTLGSGPNDRQDD